jgi:hypothetical protein
MRFILLFFVLAVSTLKAQTTIINASNPTGTSGADGSFQNGTSTFAANGWTVVNGSTNTWFVGTQSSCVGSKGAYVGTAVGNNNYTTTTSDISHFYKDVTFPAGETCITLSFNWKCEGEGGYDGMRIYLGSTAVTPVSGTRYTTTDGSAIQLGNTWYNQQASCGTSTITIPAGNAGTTKRLVFSWENDNSVGSMPAITIDAISLISQGVGVPLCTSGEIPSDGATNVSTCNDISWTAPSGCNAATSYDVYFGTSSPPPFVTNTASTSYTPSYAYNTTYYWEIRPKNASGTTAGCSEFSFTTGTSTNPQLNLIDDATSSSPYDCTTLTTTANNQRGCAWDANSTLNFTSDFSLDFEVNLGSSDGGADGIAFVIQNDPEGRCKCGTAGGSLGAGGILNSLTIEIDTYINTEDRDDFSTGFIGCGGGESPDHLDMWLNGNINPDTDFDCNTMSPAERPVTAEAVRLQNPPGTNYDIENGLNHILRISWNSGTTTITAKVLNLAGTITYGTISAVIDPMTVFGTNTPYFGFTGSTGGLTNNQSFCLPPILLPIELTKWEASCATDFVMLDWETNFENNNDYFMLEYSDNGIDFIPWKIVQAVDALIADNKLVYHERFENHENKLIYFRLSQHDIDGQISYFSIQSSNCLSSSSNLKIINQKQIDGLLNLQIETFEEGGHTVSVYNVLGELVNEGYFQFEKGVNNCSLNLSNYSESMYFIRVSNSKEIFSKKVIF